MNYLDRVYVFLKNMPPGARVNLKELKEPNRFICALNYLIETGLIDPNKFNRDDGWTKLKKTKDGVP